MEQDKVDFQLPKNRWAAVRACDEVNQHLVAPFEPAYTADLVRPASPSLYALALRILRTEKAPVDTLLLKAREVLIAVIGDGAGESKILCGYYDHTPGMRAILAALKERGV